MTPLPIDPWDFELPEYLHDVSVSPSELHPNYATVDPRQYYFDDKHITAAALPLHPLLGSEAQNSVYSFLPWPESKHDWPSGTRFTELGESEHPAIHLLIVGRARLVATLRAGGTVRKRVVAQYRPGQWIGLPYLLREHDRRVRSWAEWPDGRIRLEMEALGPVATQSIALDDALSLMGTYPDFRRFVEHHVAIRFARRREMLHRVGKNPLLRMLSPADREYLLQLGAIVAVGDVASEPYLAAGPPTGRAALVLRGEGALLVPGIRTADVRSYAATLRPGDLVGHEGLVMEAERCHPPAATVDIVEPPRTTEVRLTPGTQVLQFYWYALRWVLDDQAAVWERVKQILSGDPDGVRDPLPAIVSFHAARDKLGTTALAYGTGAELARSGKRMVEVIDLQGAENFAARWKACGFTTQDRVVPIQDGPRKRRAEGRRTEFACRVLVPPTALAWDPKLEVLWPVDVGPARVEDLVNALGAKRGVSHIIVAGTDDVIGEVLDRLHGRCSAVFYVCEDSTVDYPGVEPEDLTWVYRMTPKYLAVEQRRASRVRFDWLFASAIDATSKPVRRAIEGMLGYSPSSDLQREASEGPRRMVRVPDDPIGSQTFDHGGLGKLVGTQGSRLALGRALARLARVVERRTVGLALGGGGAWGFSHVALFRNLEAQGVPIDYIAGTSFGAVVGGLYAAGGMRALERLVDENSATGPGLGPTLRAIAAGSLNRALFVAPISSAAVETFMHGELRATRTSAGDPPCLGATEIPFYPVGTNLGTHESLVLPHATVGWGVRMSGSLPPIFATLLRGDDRVADGAFIANVPSRVVREVGAHFVIAVNVVPPPPEPTPTTFDLRSLVTRLPGKLLERLEDTVRGVFVLGWKAGQDQGALAADYALDLCPTVANLFEMWRGRDIVEEVEAKHFGPKDERRIRDAWDRFPGAGARSA